MDRLSDPRRFGNGRLEHPLLAPVAAVAVASDIEQRARRADLRAEMRAWLLAGDDAGIRDALAAMPDATHFRMLYEELARVAESPERDPQAVRLRLFAIPLVLVAAAVQQTRIAGALSDAGAVQRLFERTGVLGPMQNFGLSAALCSFEALESLTPVTICNAARMIEPRAIEARLPPADIAIGPGREQAHLRFLSGAGIARAEDPDISETGSHIGRWGGELGRLLGAQLAVPGVQLLVLPRMPQGLMRAPHAGRSAQLDVALDLFVSNTVRRFRMTSGEPVAILSTHDDGDLRLTLSSVFADDLVEGFRWPLALLDDLDAVQRAIMGLLAEVRIDDVRVVPAILPARRAGGGDWYPRAAEWDSIVSRALHH